MRKLLLFTAAALCLVGCNQNEPTKRGEDVVQDLTGRTYYSLQIGEASDVEYMFEFGKPYTNMVTHTIHNIYHTEQTSIPNENPYVWTYTFDGSNLAFESADESHQIYNATYRNDSIFFMGVAYHRLLDR